GAVAADSTVGRIGVEVGMPRDRPGLAGAAVFGGRETWDWISLTVGFVVDFFTGDVSPRSVGGPTLTGPVSGQVTLPRLEEFLRFMALFSITHAVVTLLPNPVVEGGHLMFLGVEAERGRALSLKQRMRLTQVGLDIVVAIMVWAYAN